MARFVFVTMAMLMCAAVSEASNNEVEGNPIRKVVSMLQNMQKGVEAEGAKEQDLFDKFMCYCSNGAGSLETAISTGSSSVEALTSKIDGETAMRSQLLQDVKQHEVDRSEAEKSVEEATTMRNREATEFAASSGDMKGNLHSMDGALATLKKGLGYAMLQTGTAGFLRNLITHSPAVRSSERETLLSFLDSTSGSEEAGSSDQIIGVVEQMKETMQGDLDETVSAEEQAKASFKVLTATKASEIASASRAIESKTVRAGEVAVSLAQAKADLENTQKSLEEDQTFKASLAKNCGTAQSDWDNRQKIRNEEISAISETVELLNGDDALELFKKTMPSPGGALLQFSASSQAKGHALSLLRNLMSHDSTHAAQYRLLMLALKSRNSDGFDKVVQMIDGMIAILGKEQADADTKKDYCHEEVHRAEVEEKALKTDVHNVETEVAQHEDELAQVKAEIAQTQQGLVDLDKMVAEATQQRKQEHEDYSESAASNSAALQLLDMARNRMNKFYNPSLYAAPETTTLAESVYGFVQISQHSLRLEAAPSAPGGEYKKSGKSTGIISMMTAMIRDVENDTTAAKHGEADAQSGYVEAMSEATKKRSDDSALIVDKEVQKANLAETLAAQRELRYTKRQQLGLVGGRLGDYHRSCDGFLENFDEAKANRAKEADGLKESKSVLAGATLGLVQK